MPTKILSPKQARDLLDEMAKAPALRISKKDAAAIKRKAEKLRKIEAMPPSQVTEQPWLFAVRNGRPKGVEKSGKFLVFSSVAHMDEVWVKIKQATEHGLLGGLSKVSTKQQLDLHPGRAVICCYVEDADNESEMDRVRSSLKSLGFDRLAFKLDADTYRGIYSKKHAKEKKVGRQGKST